MRPCPPGRDDAWVAALIIAACGAATRAVLLCCGPWSAVHARKRLQVVCGLVDSSLAAFDPAFYYLEPLQRGLGWSLLRLVDHGHPLIQVLIMQQRAQAPRRGQHW